MSMVDDDEALMSATATADCWSSPSPGASMLRGIWEPETVQKKKTYWDRLGRELLLGRQGTARRRRRGVAARPRRQRRRAPGHRLSTTEIESALVTNEAVAEAAVVGTSNETTGQAVAAFVIIKQSYLTAHFPNGLARSFLRASIDQIGPIAHPRDVYIVEELPKTRRARSCDGSCGTSRRDARSGTPRRSPTPP